MSMFRRMRKVLFHPLQFMEDIRDEGGAYVRDIAVILLLTVCTRIFFLMASGFSFVNVKPYSVSVFLEVLWIVLPWFTWSVSNWAVSTINDGEGKFKDIAVVSAYVYLPYIVITVPLTLVSNVLSQGEGSIYGFINSFMLVWMLFLLLLQVKVLHDFAWGKTIWTTLVSVFGMLLVWFVAVMIVGLVNQSAYFVTNIIKEIGFRS
ncbi:hypothetical protein J2T15_003925 [Paenibacillus harenae]|uniref:Yip1 domain-containing protein n=3 Tax=Paenibacillus harenae TaxID=306543 RepID=A0ABT9U4A4_PAEHA|nr:hypothetical protein [Paenibacillus harenae]